MGFVLWDCLGLCLDAGSKDALTVKLSKLSGLKHWPKVLYSSSVGTAIIDMDRRISTVRETSAALVLPEFIIRRISKRWFGFAWSSSR
jgi:hypothetical protein